MVELKYFGNLLSEKVNNFKPRNKKYLIIPGILLLTFALYITGRIIYFHSSTRLPVKIDKYFPVIDKETKSVLQSIIIKKLKNLKGVQIKLYTVKKGENYWSIAKNFGVDIDTIIGLNPYLKNTYAGLNEKLIVANKKGVIHFVRENDTLNSIAKLYNVSEKEIIKVNRLNIIKRLFGGIRKGDILFIPGAKPQILTKEMAKLFELRRVLQSPVGGYYTSGFGYRKDPFTHKRRFHNGLDIRVPVGTPVGASADGIVIFAGWAGGYGKCIKIKHFNGYTTLYGHLSRIYVKRGQKVHRGQIIGRSGRTGRATGPHLHFTVWYKGKPVNPAQFLW